MRSALQSMLGSMPSATFLASVWPLEPLLTLGDIDALQEVFAFSKVNDLDALVDCSSCQCHVYRQGPGGQLFLDAAADRYHALGQLESTCALAIDGVENARPQIHTFMTQLAGELYVPLRACSCSVFVAAGNAGVPMHFDGKEVFSIQLLGIKEWRLGNLSTRVPAPSHNYVPAYGAEMHPELRRYLRRVPELPTNQDRYVETMTPGSVMFLPRGLWHETSSREMTISVSIAIRTPTRLDMLLARIRSKLQLDPEWRTPIATAVDEDWLRRERDRITPLLFDVFRQPSSHQRPE